MLKGGLILTTVSTMNKSTWPKLQGCQRAQLMGVGYREGVGEYCHVITNILRVNQTQWLRSYCSPLTLGATGRCPLHPPDDSQEQQQLLRVILYRQE